MQMPFTGPFLVLFIFGLLGIYCGFFPFETNLRINNYVYFAGLGIVFAESYLYWIIRWKNRSPAKSWLHIILVVLTGLIPWLMMETIIFLERKFIPFNSGVLEIIGGVSFLSFFIIGHVLFALVLIKAFRRRPPSPDTSATGSDGENVLDEFIQ